MTILVSFYDLPDNILFCACENVKAFYLQNQFQVCSGAPVLPSSAYSADFFAENDSVNVQSVWPKLRGEKEFASQQKKNPGNPSNGRCINKFHL
jgi:hypothetical protein